MRYLLTLLLLAVFPAAVQAQQATGADAATPAVQMEQTVADEATPLTTTAPLPDVDNDRATDAADAPEQPMAVQDPTTRNWWWIVGAVVVGGIILAVLL